MRNALLISQTDLENEECITQARDTFRDLIVLLGTELDSDPGSDFECLSPLLDALVKLRQNFRDNRQWAEADAIRDVLYEVNISVEDARNGSRWFPVSKSERQTRDHPKLK